MEISCQTSKQMLSNQSNVWISTHGFGVDYLHIRISISPKYYGSSKLQYLPKSDKKYIYIDSKMRSNIRKKSNYRKKSDYRKSKSNYRKRKSYLRVKKGG